MKLRLPSKLVAAILAAASPVLLQTLSTATLSVAAVAAMVGEQVLADWDPATTTYTVTSNEGYGSLPADAKNNNSTKFVVLDGVTFTATGLEISKDGAVARAVTLGAASVLNVTQESGSGKRQLSSLTLDKGDATVMMGGHVGLIDSSWTTATAMNLNGHTLNLRNSGSLSTSRDFYLAATTVSAGTIDVGAGVRLYQLNSTTFNSGATVNLNEDAVLYYGYVNNSHTEVNLSSLVTGSGTVVLQLDNSGNHNAYVKVGDSFSGSLNLNGHLRLAEQVSDRNARNVSSLYLHDGQAWNETQDLDVLKDVRFGNNYDIIGARLTFSGVLTSDDNANLLISTGTTFANAGAAHIHKVTLNSGDLTLSQTATGAVTSRLYTGDIQVNGGRTLTLTPQSTSDQKSAGAAALFDGGIYLNGTASNSVANAEFTDGPVYVKDGIHVTDNGFGKLTTNHDKQHYLGGLYGESATLELRRNNRSETKGGYFHLTGAGEYSGELKLNNKANDNAYGLLVHGASLALQNTQVTFDDSSDSHVAILGFVNNGVAYDSDNKLDTANTLFADGTVAGLSGTKGSIYAHTLTINNAEGTNTFAGALAAEGLVKSGAGTQTFSGNLDAFAGNVAVNGGTLNLTPTAAMNLCDVSVADGAALNVTAGSINLAHTMSNAGAIALNGTVTVSGYASDFESYTGAGAQATTYSGQDAEGSGYLTQLGSVYLSHGTGTLNNLTLSAGEVQQVSDGYVYTGSLSGNDGVYYVNSNLSYGDSDTMKSSDTKELHVAQGATLSSMASAGFASKKLSGEGTIVSTDLTTGTYNITGADSGFYGALQLTRNDGNTTHNTKFNLSNFYGTLQYAGRFELNGSNFDHASELILVGDRASNNSGLWYHGNTARTLTQDVTLTGANPVQFEITDGSTHLTLAGAVTGAKAMKSGNGTLSFTNKVDLDELDVTNATMNVLAAAGTSSTIDLLKSNAGTTTVLQNVTATSQGGQNLAGHLTLKEGARLEVRGNDSLKYSVNQAQNIIVEEGSVINFNTARWTMHANNKLTMAGGTITGTGENASNGALDFDGSGNVVTTTKDSEIAVQIRLRNNTTEFKVEDNATLTLSGLINQNSTAGLTKTGDGNLLLKKDNTFGGTVTVNGGTIIMGSSKALGAGGKSVVINQGGVVNQNGQDNTLYNYTLAGGSLLNNGAGTSIEHVQNANLTLTADSYIGGTGNFYMIASQWGKTTLRLNENTLTKVGSNTINMYSTEISSGTLRVEDGTLNINRKDTNKVLSNVGADIVIAHAVNPAVIGDFAVSDGRSIISEVTGGTVNATVQLKGATTLKADGDASLVFAGSLSGNGSINKAGSGVAELNGTVNLLNATSAVAEGTLAVNGANAGFGGVAIGANGAMQISGNTALTLSGTLANSGSLALGGGSVQIDTSALHLFEALADTTPTYNGEGDYEGSGFLTSGSFYLIKNNGGTLEGDFGSTVGDITYEKDGNGNYTFSVDGEGAIVDPTTYYVNGAGLAYSESLMGSASKLYIAKGASLDAAASPSTDKTLIGSGTYHYTHATDAPSHLLIGASDAWTGVVVLDGLTKNGNFSLNNYGNEASWVQLTGVSCWDTNWNGHVTANLILENREDGTVAWKYQGDASAVNYMYLDGRVKGHGTLELSKTGNNQWVAFTNDISEWDGTLSALADSGKSNNVKFAGNANVVNATITHTGGNMYITAETDVTFNKNVTANTLTTNGHQITIGQRATITLENALANAVSGDQVTDPVIKDTLTSVYRGEGTLNFKIDDSNEDKARVLSRGAQLEQSVSNVIISAGSLIVNNWSSPQSAGGYTIGAGKSLSLADNLRLETSADLQVQGSLTVGGQLQLGHTGSGTAYVHISGDADVALGGILINNTTEGKIFEMTGGYLTFTNEGNVFSDANASDTTTSFSISGATLLADTNNWVFNHDVTIGDVTVETEDGHTVTLGGANRNLIITDLITNNGNLVLSGNINVDRPLDTTAGTFSKGTYGYLEGVSMVIVENGDGATVSAAEGTTWTLDGMSAAAVGFETSSFDNGTLTMSGATGEGFAAGRWFMNSGEGKTYTYDGTDARMTSILINAKDGAELTLATNDLSGLTGGITVNGVDAKINIDSDTEITKAALVPAITLKDEGTAKLSGSGTYTLASGEQTIGAIALSDTWEGTVKLSGNISNIDLTADSGLGTAQSYVKLDGVTGQFKGGDQTVATNVIIDGTLLLRAPNSGTTTFTGSLSGSGEIKYDNSGDRDLNLAFTGDVSDFVGAFAYDRCNDQRNMYVTFSGEANEINAGFKTTTNSYGSMNLTFAADATVVNGSIDNSIGHQNLKHQQINLTANNNTTFTDTVKANKLTIADGKSATFNETSTLTALSGAGSLKVAGTDTTGGLLTVTGASDNFTGAVTLSYNTNPETATADSVGLVVQNSTALSNSVVTFDSGSGWNDTTYASSLLAFRDAAGNAIDGTVAGLSGNRGHVVADTLTINVASGTPLEFRNRYDNDDRGTNTNDSAVLTVNKLIKTGAGTQEIGGEYAGEGGLVIARGIEVQEGTLHLKTRGAVTADMTVSAGATLKTTDSQANAETSGDALQYVGGITLNGTAESTATLDYEDGSTYFTKGLTATGAVTIYNRWAKQQYVKSLTGTDVTLTIDRTNSDGNKGGYVNVMGTSETGFSGTIKLISRENELGGGLVMHDAPTALANTVVDFTGANNSKNSLLAFIEGDGTFNNSNKLADSNTFTAGTVAGLAGDKGVVKAGTLTINTAATKEYTYGGTLEVTGLVKTGEGSQILSGSSVTSAPITIENGTLTLHDETIVNVGGPIANEGTLVLDAPTVNVNRTLDTSVGVFSEGEDHSYGYLTGVSAQIVTGSGQVNADAVTNWTVGGMTAADFGFNSTSFANGTLTMSGATGSGIAAGTWFMNSGEGKTYTYNGTDARMTSILINAHDGAVLTLATGDLSALTNGITVNGVDAKINLANGTVVTKESLTQKLTLNDGGTAKLTGEGTYVLAAGETELASNSPVQLDASWVGALRLSGEMNAVTFSQGDRRANANSWVELAGVYGYIHWASTTSNAKLILSDADEETPAFKMQDSSGKTYSFTNTVKGSGTFESAIKENTGYRNNNYVFSGDVSEWTGKFLSSSAKGAAGNAEGNTVLLFNNSATAINAAVESTGTAKLTLKLENSNAVTMNGDITKAKTAGELNIEASAPATFTGNVAADKLTISAGKSATFSAAAGKQQSLTTLTGSGDLTVSGVAATETTAATGGLLRVTKELESEGDIFTGSVTLSNTQSADAVGLVLQATGRWGGAVCKSVINFESGDAWDNDTYTRSLLAFRSSTGTVLDGTVAGLSGNRGHIIAKTLTINVADGEEYAFLHRYEGDTTHDSAVLEVNRLVKGGTGTQVIGGEYTGKNGLVISGGVSVGAGTLHMKTRGTVTTDFDVAAGATLLTTDNSTNCTSAANAVQYKGSVTLVMPIDSRPAATLNFADGSTNITEGLNVQVRGQVINSKGKNQFINGLYGMADNLTFTRTGDDTDGTAINVLTAKGEFTGTVHLESTVAKDNGYGLQVLGTTAKDALANTVVDFAGENETVLSFRNGTEASADWTDSKMDGSVAGLTGTNGAVYADTLTVDASDTYTYGGALNVANIVKDGTGTQNISGNVNSFNGNIDVNDGTLAFTGLSSDATNNLHVSTATVSDNGSLKAGRATLTAKEAPMARTVSKTGTVENAEFTNDSLAGTGKNGGSITNGLLAIQEVTTYTISDMTLTNSKISAAGTHLEMSNINVDANSNVVALNESTLSGSNRLTLSAGVGIKDGVTVESSQLSGLTLTGDSNLTIDLSAHGYAAGATDKSIFHIELSDFSWDELAGAAAGKVYEGSKDINQVFQVLALGSTDTFYKVLSVTQGVGAGFANSGITLEVQVPEPTTSVLSLLALAGMAARRRRK